MVYVECLWAPAAYSREQIQRSLNVAAVMGRGRFLLLEAPAKCPVCLGRPKTYCVACGLS